MTAGASSRPTPVIETGYGKDSRRSTRPDLHVQGSTVRSLHCRPEPFPAARIPDPWTGVRDSLQIARFRPIRYHPAVFGAYPGQEFELWATISCENHFFFAALPVAPLPPVLARNSAARFFAAASDAFLARAERSSGVMVSRLHLPLILPPLRPISRMISGNRPFVFLSTMEQNGYH